MKTLKFGIEMEMTGITRKNAAEIISKVLGTNNTRYTGGTDGYNTWSAFDAQGRKWKAMYDGSLSTERLNEAGQRVSDHTSEMECEVVSPICTYEDIETIQAVVRALKQAGALVNRSCGIHIHVGAEKFDAQHLRVLSNMVASKEELLIKALKIQNRRLGHFCQRTNKNFIKEMNDKKPATEDALMDLWYDSQGYHSGATHYARDHYNDTRYHILNLHAYNTKGTVEFRCFEATLHAGKVKAYLQMALAISAAALKARSASPRETVTDNPKYTFRCWMLRLGLIGDEFKTCRYHLLNNLEGNAAWRRQEATA